jgi:CRISPR-associated protein Cmr4
MKTHILHIFTRTPLHVGAGSSVGAVDQPIQRERHTGFPIIPGSSIKGVLRDFFAVPEEGDDVFGCSAKGKDDSGSAGALAFGEARLLLFPVRSARGSYAMATCPLALARYARDAGLKEISVPNEPTSGSALIGSAIAIGGESPGCVLEEYAFAKCGDFPKDWADRLSKLIDDPVLRESVNRFALLSNEDFSHFALNACQVQQHVKIDPKTGTVDGGMLFNEETVPAETLFYGLITEVPRGENHRAAIAAVLEKLKMENLIQFGGNATTGLGFCSTKVS